MKYRLIKADVPSDFSSEVLGTNANDLANEVYPSLAMKPDMLQDIIFNGGQNLEAYINTNYIQNLADQYTSNNQNYDAGTLNVDSANMSKAVFNNICNKLESMNFKEVLSYFGVILVRQ